MGPLGVSLKHSIVRKVLHRWAWCWRLSSQKIFKSLLSAPMQELKTWVQVLTLSLTRPHLVLLSLSSLCIKWDQTIFSHKIVMMVKWTKVWKSTSKPMLWLLLFGVCPFPPAQNNKLDPKPESQKWGTEPNWKTIMTTHSSLALWCVFSWSVKLSGEGKENRHSAGLRPAHIAKTNLGGRQSRLLGMEKTLISPSLCWNGSNV